LGLQENLEYGIYPERPISDIKIGMILIGSKRFQEDPGLFSIRFTGGIRGFVLMGKERQGGCG